MDPALLIALLAFKATPSEMIKESVGLLRVRLPIARLKSSVEFAVEVPITMFSPVAGMPLSHCAGSLHTPVLPVQLSVCAKADPHSMSSPRRTKQAAVFTRE